MLGGADNPNGELPSYITGADTGCFVFHPHIPELLKEREHHTYGVCFLGVEVRIKSII